MSIDMLGNYYNKALEAVSEKKWGAAVEHLKKVLDYRGAFDFDVSSIYYYIACCYAQDGQLEESFSKLEQAIREGYSGAEDIKHEIDLEILWSTNPQRTQQLYSLCKELYYTNLLSKSKLFVEEYDGMFPTEKKMKFIWDRYDNPKLLELREKYQLLDVIKTGKDEFEKMLLMLDWVANRFDHQGNYMGPERDALALLDQAAHGTKMKCVEYSIVLAHCLTAIGYPARTAALIEEVTPMVPGRAHLVTEVWSNQYQKWIVLDGQNNAYWVYNSMPLSAAECRKLLLDKKMDEVTFEGRRSGKDYAVMKYSWFPYFYHLTFSYSNAYFDDPREHRSTTEGRFEFISDGIKPQLLLQAMPNKLAIESDYDMAYPKLNQTIVEYGFADLSKVTKEVILKFSNTMPYFDHYKLYMNHKEQIIKKDNFFLSLEKGTNEITIKAVNKYGVEGRRTKLKIRCNIE